MIKDHIGVLMGGVMFLGGIIVAAMTVLPSMKAINDGLSCIATTSCEDLAAQQSMAVAAWVMVGATFLSVIVGWITLILVFTTFQTAVRSAVAAEAQVKVAEEIGVKQIRAYLSIVALDLHSDLPSTAKFVIKLKNSGQSPALTPHVLLKVSVQTNEQVEFSTQRRVVDIPAQGDSVVEATIRQRYLPAFAPKNVRLRIVATLTYEDVFRRRQVETAYFYHRTSTLRSGQFLLRRDKADEEP